MNITNQLDLKHTKDYNFPNKLIPLVYSPHAKKRLVERTSGSLILAPQYIRLTKNNTIDVKLKKGKIYEATAIIDYKHNVKMYLPLMVYSGIVKTIYFKNVKKKWNSQKELPIKNKIKITEQICCSEEISENKNTGREIEKSEGIRENVEYVQGNLRRKKISRWQSVFSAIRNIYSRFRTQL